MSRSIKPHPAINRKEWMENHLINRRNHEDAVRSSWNSTAKYFQAWDVKAKKYAELTSPESYQTSMNAYIERKRRDDEENMLNLRRQKLADLFRQENEKYQAELKAQDRRYRKTPTMHLAKSETSRPFMSLSPFHVDVQSPTRTVADDDAEKDVPAILPATVDRGASASLRAEVPHSKQMALQTAVQRGASSTPRAEASPVIRGEGAARVTTPVIAQHSDSSGIRAEAPDGCSENVTPASRRQVEDLVETMKWKEREASALKQECAALNHALGEVQRLSQQRLQLDKWELHLEPTNRGNKLRQPYKILIQKQLHTAQHLMEFDLKFVKTMLCVLRLIDDKDSSLSDDLGQIHLQITQNLKVEQQELLQSECLFHEEAERMWHHKVDEWKEERVSRAALIEKARKLIESKVQSRLAANLERQHGNITSRENMLSVLDAGSNEQPKI